MADVAETSAEAPRNEREIDTYLLAAETQSAGSPALADTPVVPDEHLSTDTIVVVDFGSQYSQLIARRIREAGVYSEIVEHDARFEAVAALRPKGYILSGGPASVYEPNSPRIPEWILNSDVPILGICYGMQALAHQLAGRVAPSQQREYGHSLLHHEPSRSPLFDSLNQPTQVWMSHGDRIDALPPGFRVLARTENSPCAAMGDSRGRFGLQFHPEVAHTPQGAKLLENFLYKVCGCTGNWSPANFIDDSVAKIRAQVGSGRVLCALSGGVDSSVTALLIQRAIGSQLTCVFVDNGLLRQGEAEQVRSTFERHFGLDLRFVDAADRFLTRLQGVTDPEEKRRIIGDEFIRVFESAAREIGHADFLAQGTLYPDVIESAGSSSKTAAKIKTHHNVGLPADLKFGLVEPLRFLFKDEVRRVGMALGLPSEIVHRQPFPGPGLAVRVLGEITRERLDVLRSADAVFLEEVRASGLEDDLWQWFVVLTPLRTVGVMGDFRTYGNVVAIRAVTSEDAMTADWARLPYDLLARVSSRIVNEVEGVNRVVYDITSKPPGTIEWE